MSVAFHYNELDLVLGIAHVEHSAAQHHVLLKPANHVVVGHRYLISRQKLWVSRLFDKVNGSGFVYAYKPCVKTALTQNIIVYRRLTCVKVETRDLIFVGTVDSVSGEVSLVECQHH